MKKFTITLCFEDDQLTIAEVEDILDEVINEGLDFWKAYKTITEREPPRFGSELVGITKMEEVP